MSQPATFTPEQVARAREVLEAFARYGGDEIDGVLDRGDSPLGITLGSAPMLLLKCTAIVTLAALDGINPNLYMPSSTIEAVLGRLRAFNSERPSTRRL